VLSGVPSPDRPDGREALGELVATLGEVEGVTRTWSHLDQADPFFVGPGQGTFVIVGLDPHASPDSLVARLREEGGTVAARLRPRFPDAALRWTGEPVLNIDFRRASAEEVRAAAHTVLERPGGGGAAREMIELILKARGDWEKLIAKFSLDL